MIFRLFTIIIISIIINHSNDPWFHRKYVLLLDAFPAQCG